MFYYNVALPLKGEQFYTYKSSIKLKRGCRIAVDFNGSLKTAIILKETHQVPENITIKQINMIIDLDPLINEELLELAEWISNYYCENIGIVLQSMLPSGLNISLISKVRKVKNKSISDSDGTPELILNYLNTQEWTFLDDLRQSVKVTKLLYWLEKLEEQGIIESEFSFDNKISKKIANFVRINNKEWADLKLTELQTKFMVFLSNINDNAALSTISKEFSYSVVKTLAKRGIVDVYKKELKESSLQSKLINEAPIPIEHTDEQILAIDKINSSVNESKFSTYLLFGVTGSGKTEVYIESIRNCLKENKTSLLLLPEIALTPQMINRFSSHFTEDISVLHSNLNERERLYEWKRINEGRTNIVIGARSAIFAPLKNLGLIIVDEEHENTYKQENSPRYNARDVSLVRAKLNNAVVVLGSATPSMESLYNVSIGKYNYLCLKKRPENVQMPTIEIIDMRLEKRPEVFSAKLLEKIKDRLEKQ
ncbi:MAG: primosomal protein N', partial [Candidatus Cloacimonetes bacterium]|nr:primosomal protein N' [Candidatus Cloacimonadota bacterium]